MKILIEKYNAKVNIIDRDGFSLLIDAALEGHYEIVKYLV